MVKLLVDERSNILKLLISQQTHRRIPLKNILKTIGKQIILSTDYNSLIGSSFHNSSLPASSALLSLPSESAAAAAAAAGRAPRSLNQCLVSSKSGSIW